MKKYSLEEIYEQAMNDNSSMHTTMSRGNAIINMGVKLQKFSSNINCSKGGDYFKELSSAEYEIFYNEGWKIGCIKTAMNNCLYKLDLIESRMKIEVNTRKNDKHIQNLKSRRENILHKYSKHNNKLLNLN